MPTARIVNLTQHPINIYTGCTPDQGTEEELRPGLLVTIPPSGTMARLRTANMGLRDEVTVGGIPVDVEGVQYGAVDGLPAPADDVWYVVPLLTALAAHRGDLLVPHQQVRNEKGTVVGCKMFGLVER